MESSADWENRVSHTQTNPLFEMSLGSSDLYSFQPDDLKPVRTRRPWCLYVIVVYLILQTGLNAFLIYTVRSLESSLSNPQLGKQTSNQNGPPGDDNLQTLVHNNSQETKTLQGRLGALQTQVNHLCGEDGQLSRLTSDLSQLNTSTLTLEGKLSSISLRQGLPGLKGDPGPKGIKGDTGDVGTAGLKGDTGPKGERGALGPDGPPGPRGLVGAPGNEGPGAKGEKGDRGASGPEGAKGDSGNPGPAGATGIPGRAGAQGPKGEQGNNGLQGPKGSMGPPGLKGNQGPPGPAGSKGERGAGQVNVRLVPGSSRGRVEVKYNGLWGTICDDGFDNLDGNVICRMLGYQSASTFYQASAGSGNIWLDDLQCRGTESDIFDCTHNGIGVNNCQHSEDVGVQCV